MNINKIIEELESFRSALFRLASEAKGLSLAEFDKRHRAVMDILVHERTGALAHLGELFLALEQARNWPLRPETVKILDNIIQVLRTAQTMLLVDYGIYHNEAAFREALDMLRSVQPLLNKISSEFLDAATRMGQQRLYQVVFA